jgi:hypothetical protein
VASSRGVPLYEPSEVTAEEPRPERPARRPPVAEPAPEPDEPAAEEEEPEEPPEEALSLRERLARAAAARHRTSQPPE